MPSNFHSFGSYSHHKIINVKLYKKDFSITLFVLADWKYHIFQHLISVG